MKKILLFFTCLSMLLACSNEELPSSHGKYVEPYKDWNATKALIVEEYGISITNTPNPLGYFVGEDKTSVILFYFDESSDTDGNERLVASEIWVDQPTESDLITLLERKYVRQDSEDYPDLEYDILYWDGSSKKMPTTLIGINFMEDGSLKVQYVCYKYYVKQQIMLPR